jgi:hypothetical protein
MKVPLNTDFLSQPAPQGMSYIQSRVGKVIRSKSLSVHEVYAKNIAGEIAARAAITSWGMTSALQKTQWETFAAQIPWKGSGLSVTTAVTQRGAGLLLALNSKVKTPPGEAIATTGGLYRKRGVEMFLAYNVASELAAQAPVMSPPTLV